MRCKDKGFCEGKELLIMHLFLIFATVKYLVILTIWALGVKNILFAIKQSLITYF